MKGGHSQSGPARDPNALRRERDSGTWVHLPALGRPGDPPPWPLSRQSGRERTLWTAEWTRPQAVMWEANGQAVEVAIYVRTLALAEHVKAPVAARTLLRQQMEALGISVPGLARNRWVIELAEEPRPQVASDAEPVSVRDRLRVVGGG